MIEVDGSVHNKEEVKQADDRRQKELEDCSIKVLRFTNDEVTMQLGEVKGKIENYILENCLPKQKAQQPKSLRQLAEDRGTYAEPFE